MSREGAEDWGEGIFYDDRNIARLEPRNVRLRRARSVGYEVLYPLCTFGVCLVFFMRNLTVYKGCIFFAIYIILRGRG